MVRLGKTIIKDSNLINCRQHKSLDMVTTSAVPRSGHALVKANSSAESTPVLATSQAVCKKNLMRGGPAVTHCLCRPTHAMSPQTSFGEPHLHQPCTGPRRVPAQVAFPGCKTTDLPKPHKQSARAHRSAVVGSKINR